MSYFLENEEVEKVEEVKEQDGIASIEPLLDNRIVRAIREMGFEKLSPIQEQAIHYRVRTLSDRHRPERARLLHSAFRRSSTSIRM